MRSVVAGCLVLASCCYLSVAAPPLTELDYQGRVLVNDLPINGSGCFKFAIADQAGTTNYWSNDATPVGQPAGHLTNSVFNGVFSTILGAPPMVAIDPAIFAQATGLYLRVWFSATPSNFVEMLPAQKVVASALAMNAVLVDGQSPAQIVSAATNAITLAGDVTGAPHANSIAAGAIVNADVNAGAAIEGSKLQQGTITNAGAVQFAGGFGAAAPLRAIDDSDTRLNAFGVVNSFTAAVPGSSLTISGGTGITVSDLPGNIIQITGTGGGSVGPLSNVVYVAPSGAVGNDGSIGSPLPNPQEGYAVAAAGAKPAAVVIASGNYGTNGLLMDVPDIHVFGAGRPEIAWLSVQTSPTVVSGKTRIEGLLVRQIAEVWTNASKARFFNCTVRGGATVYGSQVEFHACTLTSLGGSGSALSFGPSGTPVTRVGVFSSSLVNSNASIPALVIGEFADEVQVVGCSIINKEGQTGAAIGDSAASVATLRLISHNVIKGPAPGADFAAVVHAPYLLTPTMLFTHNTVYGDVGVRQPLPPAPNGQYYANNTVFGTINYASGGVGWIQAGLAAADVANNTEFSGPLPTFPTAWED